MTELTQCFILHQRSYRETSLLLDIFSKNYGRVSLIAKGVRQKKRSKIGLYQLYQPLLVAWMGKGELLTLTTAETHAPRYILKAESALCGLYINELMVKLLPLHESEPELFNAYQYALESLQAVDNTQLALRLFEKRLLTHLGYGLVLDREFETGQLIDEQQQYYYQADAGLARWYPGLKQPAISGRSLRHLLDESGFDSQSLSEIKQLMRTVIHFYLGGKPLQSRQLFTELHRLK
ncbi:MAG: DNA repair protein RecO [Methylophaga sp.]|nr:DNA repair protein RecO [Methylophaga sp.]